MAIEVIEKTETLEELGITLEWVKTNAPDLAEKLPDNEALAKKLFVGKASKEFQAQYMKVLDEIKERFQQNNDETEVPEETAPLSSDDSNETTGYGILETIIQAAMNVPVDIQSIQLDIQDEHKERFLKSVFQGFNIPIKDGKVKPMDIYNRLG